MRRIRRLLNRARARANSIIKKTLQAKAIAKPKGPSDDNPLDAVPVPDYSLKNKMLPLEEGAKITKPYKYQRIGIKRISYFGGRALLADEMGLGKTIQMIMWWYRHRDIASPMVIVCAASLKENMQRELDTHVGIRPLILKGRKPDRRKLMTNRKVIIINFEIAHAWGEAIRDTLKPQLVCIDECQRIKNMKSKARQGVATMCENAPYVIGASGTPVVNRPAEMYSILNILRPNIWNSENAFMWKYTKPKRMRGRWQFTGANIANLPHLNKMLNDHCMIRRQMSDVVQDLPARHRIPVLMSFSEEAKKEYEFAEREFAKWLKQYSDKKVRRILRAEQLAKQGYLKRLAARLKVKSVKQWIDNFLEETDEKLVLFAIHKKMVNTLQKKYADICVVVDGSIKGSHRMAAVDKFQDDPKTKLFIGNIQAAGVGLNLTASRTTAFAELGWTPGEHAQAEARVRRINKIQMTNHYYLIAPGTIEEDLCNVIQTKQRINNSILDGGVIDSDLNIADLLNSAIEKRYS